jgi:hypothetical protein
MAYDGKLADRLRVVLAPRPGLSERKQFGGVGFLINGNMACGVIGTDLLVRVGPDAHAQALKSRDARPFALTGRPSAGWILVRPSGVRTAASLKKWAELGVAFAKTLPAK